MGIWQDMSKTKQADQTGTSMFASTTSVVPTSKYWRVSEISAKNENRWVTRGGVTCSDNASGWIVKWSRREELSPAEARGTSEDGFTVTPPSLSCARLDYNPLHCTALHHTIHTTLHYTTLHCTTLHYSSLTYATLYHTTRHYTIHRTTCTTPHHTNLYYTTLHSIIHFASLHNTTTQHYPTLRYALHYNALHYITLHYTAVHCTTLNYTTHFTSLRFTTQTLHYATLNYTFYILEWQGCLANVHKSPAAGWTVVPTHSAWGEQQPGRGCWRTPRPTGAAPSRTCRHWWWAGSRSAATRRREKNRSPYMSLYTQYRIRIIPLTTKDSTMGTRIIVFMILFTFGIYLKEQLHCAIFSATCNVTLKNVLLPKWGVAPCSAIWATYNDLSRGSLGKLATGAPGSALGRIYKEIRMRS